MHRATPEFWHFLERLPEPTQRVARRNFDLLKTNPRHPSLQFKRVSRSYRALAVEDGDDFIWVWIGTHGEYDRRIRS